GTLTFAPGETTKTVTIGVIGDAVAEATESFFVGFANAIGAKLAIDKAVVTIIDDDSTSWITTSVADFNAGTLDAGAYISRTNNGEIILAPAIGAEFQGRSIPAGWSGTALAA